MCSPQHFSGFEFCRASFRSVICVVVIAVALILTPVSSANTFTWTQVAGGNWSTAGNWDTQPSPGGNPTDILLFSTDGTYTSNYDAAFGAGPYSLNQLNFAHNSGTITITADAGNSLAFSGTTPSLNVSGGGNAIVSAPITLNADTLFRVSNAGITLTLSGPINNGASALTIGGYGNTTLNGIVGNGSGGLTKSGSGTLTINGASGAQAYTGATTVSGGTLALSYANVATDLINNSSALTVAGGILSLTSGAGASSQTFNGPTGGPTFTISGGGSTIALSNAGGGAMTLNLPSTWNRALGGTVNFVLPSPTTNTIVNSAPGMLNGIIGSATNGGYATIGTATTGTGLATDWATISGGKVAPLNSNVTTFTSTSNTYITTGTAAFNADTNSIRYDTGSSGNTTTITGTRAVLSGGILVTSNLTGAGTITISGGTSLKGTSTDLVINQYAPANGTSLTIATPIFVNGSMGVTKNGSGLLIITSTTNTYTGPLTINGGVVQGAAANNFAPNATPIILSGGGINVVAANLNGNHPISVTNDSAIITTGGSTVSAAVGSGGAIALSNGAVLSLFANGGNLTVARQITGNGSINATGTSVVIATATGNTYTGTTYITQNGQLRPSPGFLPTGSQIVLGEAATNTGGTLDLRALGGAGFTITGNQTLIAVGAGANIISSATAPELLTFNIPASGKYTYTGSITGNVNTPVQMTVGNNATLRWNVQSTAASIANLNSSISAGGSVVIDISNIGLTVTPSTASTFGGIIQGTNPLIGLSLGIQTAGTAQGNSLLLNAQNTYVGPTFINNGSIILGVNNALPTTTALQIGNSGGAANTFIDALDLNGKNQTVASLAASPEATGTTNSISIFNNSGAGTSLLTVTGGTTTFGGANATGTVNLKDNNGNVGGIVALAVTGGTLTFGGTGSYTYTGGTTLSGSGTLVIPADSYLGGGSLTVNTGGTLRFASAGGVSLAGTRTVTVGGGAFDTNSGNDTILSNISGTNFNKTGTGTLTLTPAVANTYTGTLSIQAGTVAVGNNSAIPSGTGISLGATTNSGVLDLNGNTVAVGALATSGTGNANNITNGGGSAATLNFNGGSGTSTFGGNILFGSAGTNLVVNSGTLRLTGTGGTASSATANGGKLIAGAGSLGAATTVAVADNATFGASVVSGPVVTIANLNVGTTATGGIVEFDINGNPTLAPLNVTGTLTVPGAGNTGVTVVNGATALAVGNNIPLLTYGAVVGNLAGFQTGTITLPPRVVGTIDATSANALTNKTIYLNISAIDTITWVGNNGGIWNINNTVAWRTTTGNVATTYLESTPPGDSVNFNGSATGTKTVDIQSTVSPASLTVDTGGGNYTFTSTNTGHISGAVALTKIGSGTLFINNSTANDYTGGTAISSGTVQIDAAGSLPVATSGNSVTLSGGGALAFNKSSPFTFGGKIADTDATGQVKVLANTVTLTNAANSWGGGTSISSGATLQIGDGTLSGALLGAVTNAGTLIFNPAASGIVSPATVNGSGASTVQSAGANPVTLSGNLIGSGMSLLVGGATQTVTLTGSGNTYGGGTTINNGNTLAVGDLTSSGSLPSAGTLTDNGSLVFNPGASGIVVGSLIAGNGTVTVNGGANITQLTNAANSYTGRTTIQAGTLSISSDGDLGTPPGSPTPNSLVMNNAGSILIATSSFGINANRNLNVTATGVTIKVATGQTLTMNALMALSTNNIHFGDTSGTFNGTFVAAGVPNTGAATFTLDGGSTVRVDAPTITTLKAVLNNTSTFIVNNVIETLDSLASTPTTTSVQINGASGSLLVTSTATSTTFNGVISGIGSFSKQGAGTTITLGNNNTYTGGTTISSASSGIKIAVDNALPVNGTFAFTTTNGAGTSLDLNGHNQRVGSLTSATTTGSVLVQNTGVGPNTLTVSNGSGSGNFSATTSGTSVLTGPVALTVVGGTLVLGSANSYTGNTTINAGQITANFNSSTTTQSTILPSSTIVNLGGGTLQVTGSNSSGNTSHTATQTVAGVILNAGNSAISTTTGATVDNLTVNLNGITRNSGATVDFTLPTVGVVSPSVITTTTPNQTSGGASGTILGGWATVSNNTWAAVAATPVTNNVVAFAAYITNDPIFAGGGDQDAVPDVPISPLASTTINSLRFNNPATTGYTFTPTSANDTLTIATGGILVTQTVGAFPANFDTGGIGVLTSGNGQDLIVNQRNTGALATMTIGSKITGAIGLTKTGGGILVLTNAANTYSGATYILGGTLSIGSFSSLGTSNSAAGNLYIANGNLTYTGPGESTDRLFTFGNSGVVTIAASGSGALNFTNTGSLAFASTSTLTNNAIAASLTLTGSNTAVNTFAPKITDVATIVTTNVTTSVTKSGAGTWALTNANTYTGPTTITAGTLVVGVGGTGSLGNSPVAVNSAATLGGSGAIGGTVAINTGGGVAPGNSIGTLTVGNGVTTGPAMTWQQGGHFDFEYKADPATFSPGPIPAAGTDNDQIRSTNATQGLDLSGLSSSNPFVFNLLPTNVPPANPGMVITYTVATFPGGITPIGAGDQAKFAFNGFFDPNFGAPVVSTGLGNTVLTVSFAPVPEPAFVLLACGAVAGGLGWWKRRRWASVEA
jgi:fibronectin-binding autotransporter adhesin